VAYSEALADRVRHLLGCPIGLEEKRMFGGLAFLQFGNLVVGVRQDSLLARLGPEAGAEALNDPAVGPFINAGRTFDGWVVIGPDGYENDGQLAGWLRRAMDFAGQLPARTRGGRTG
jgi:hypothetical protein